MIRDEGLSHVKAGGYLENNPSGVTHVCFPDSLQAK